MLDNLRVEKKEEQVSLFMADGITFEGHIHLAQYAMHHSGEQTVLDLLIEENPFLPMHSSSGEFHLVQKVMISHLRCNVPLNKELEYTEQQVKISFPGGKTLQGSLKIDRTDRHVRLAEYINGGNNFFPLFSGEIAYLVNRNLIRDIVLLDG